MSSNAVASLIIATSVVGFLYLSWLLGQHTLSTDMEMVAYVFRHGFEGALVGGICDFFAVHMVYKAAQDKFSSLRDHTTVLVVKDMIQVQKKVDEYAQLDVFLQNKENQQQFVNILQSVLPVQEDVQREIAHFWNTNLRADVVHWLTEYPVDTLLQSLIKSQKEPSSTSGRMQIQIFQQTFAQILEKVAQEKNANKQLIEKFRLLIQELSLADIGIPATEDAVRSLLQEIWKQWQKIGQAPEYKPGLVDKMLHAGLADKVISILSPKVAAKVQDMMVLDVVSPLLSEQSMQKTLLAFAEQLRVSSTESTETNELTELTVIEDATTPFFVDVLEYFLVFCVAWRDLSYEERKLVIEELVNIVEKPVLGWISETVWSIRQDLLTPEILLEKRIAKQLVDMVSTHLKEKSAHVEFQAQLALQKQLDEMGAKGFVNLLRSNTQSQLDKIKVNGTVFGFVLGCVVGGLGLLFVG